MSLSDDDLRAIWQQAPPDSPADRSGCLTDAEWTRLLSNDANDAERVRAARHLASCAACVEEYRLLQPLQSWAADAGQALSPRGAAADARTTAMRSWWAGPAALPLAAAAVLLVATGLVLAQLMAARRENAALQAQLADRDRALAAAQASAATLEEKLRTASARQPRQPDGSPPPLGNLEQLVEAVTSNNDVLSLNASVRQELARRMAQTPPALAGLITKTGTLLGPNSGTAFQLVAPVGTVVQDDRPVFRWQPFGGAARFTVAVSDADFKPVATSPPLTAAEWRPSAPLARGRVYSWQVTAVRDGKEIVSPAPPSPEARFQVLDAARAAPLAQAVQTHRDSPLALAVVFAGEGLMDDAERELERLIASSPGATFPRELLQSVQSIRRRTR